jgi:hypothetical protein
MQKSLEPTLAEVVAMLQQCDSKSTCLESAYATLTKRYYGDRVCTFTKIHRIFDTNPLSLWGKP